MVHGHDNKEHQRAFDRSVVRLAGGPAAAEVGGVRPDRSQRQLLDGCRRPHELESGVLRIKLGWGVEDRRWRTELGTRLGPVADWHLPPAGRDRKSTRLTPVTDVSRM